MGAIINSVKLKGVAINGKIAKGLVKNGVVFWKQENFHQLTNRILARSTEIGATPPTNLILFDNYIRSIADILIENFDVFFRFRGSGDANFKRINLANPEGALAGFYGGYDLDNSGIKGNGVNAYVDTNFNPSLLVSGQKYQLNDASRGAVISSEAMGSNATSFIDISANGYNTLSNFSNTLHRINQGVNNLPINVDMLGTGFKSISRYDSSNVSLINKSYNNATKRSSTIIENGVQMLIGRTNANFSVIGISSYFMGKSISFELSQQLRNIENADMANLGLPQIA